MPLQKGAFSRRPQDGGTGSCDRKAIDVIYLRLPAAY